MMNIGHLAKSVAFYYLENLTIVVINFHKYHYDVIYNKFLVPYFVKCYREIKKPPQTSTPSSKLLKISLVVTNSWLIQESPGLKPDWLVKIVV